jgi:hypothetical protein
MNDVRCECTATRDARYSQLNSWMWIITVLAPAIANQRRLWGKRIESDLRITYAPMDVGSREAVLQETIHVGLQGNFRQVRYQLVGVGLRADCCPPIVLVIDCGTPEVELAKCVA